MSQWGNVDNAANSVNWAVSQLNKAITSANTTELFGNTTANVYFTNATIGQFGVDTTEQQASEGGPTHAGWVLRTEGSGGRAGRITHETLVAMGSMSSDDEDAVFPDYRITISSQPEDSNLVSGNAVNFTVIAATVPTGGTLTYQWQVDGGPGSETFVNVANTGVYASANGNTSATLSISDNTDLDGNVYRVVVSVTGGDDVNSANVTLNEA